MKEPSNSPLARILLPLAVFAGGILLWAAVAQSRIFHESTFPAPYAVLQAFVQEVRSGRLFQDLIASLWRIYTGFMLALITSVPIGLGLGHAPRARMAFLPAINFFRNLSPLAWITFAILWFKIGDPPAIFLIFLAAFFPMTLSIIAAVANIPSVYFQVARDYGLTGVRLLTGVTLPAIMPQFITTLRITAGIAWMVVVAAEMIAGSDGLGFAVWDSRNGLRTDLLVCAMIVIGLMGVAIDRILIGLTRLPSVRWGYEQ